MARCEELATRFTSGAQAESAKPIGRDPLRPLLWLVKTYKRRTLRHFYGLWGGYMYMMRILATVHAVENHDLFEAINSTHNRTNLVVLDTILIQYLLLTYFSQGKSSRLQAARL